MPFLEGAAKAVLYCAHRTSIILLIDPSKLACVFSPGRAPMLVYVRPSNEALLRARVPGAQDQRGCHSIPFIVRVLRARRTPGRSLPIPSETARCASTEDHQASSPLRSASKKGTWLLPARLADFFSSLLMGRPHNVSARPLHQTWPPILVQWTISFPADPVPVLQNWHQSPQ